jgi:hypothetical protein
MSLVGIDEQVHMHIHAFITIMIRKSVQIDTAISFEIGEPGLESRLGNACMYMYKISSFLLCPIYEFFQKMFPAKYTEVTSFPIAPRKP